MINRWYLDTIRKILEEGDRREGRNGEIISNFFVDPYKIDLGTGYFPKVTVKKCSWKKTQLEGLYFLSGETKVDTMPKCLVDTWWKPWANERSFGRFYGYQLRRKEGYFDQLDYVIDLIKNDPNSRRIVLTLWNPADIAQTVLPACHSTLIQFYVRRGNLDMKFYSRSQDVLLGTPHNIMWAAMLNILIANEVGIEPGILEYHLGDAHIYKVHEEQAKKLINYRHKYINFLPKYEIYPEFKGLSIEEVLVRAEQSCLNRDDRWDTVIGLSEHKNSEIKLGRFELVA